MVGEASQGAQFGGASQGAWGVETKSHAPSKEDVVIGKPVWVTGVEFTGKLDPDSHFVITFGLADKLHFLRFQTQQGGEMLRRQLSQEIAC